MVAKPDKFYISDPSKSVVIKTYDDAVNLWLQLQNILGPWVKHVHGFGCECGGYPPSNPYRCDWWYRSNLEGIEMVNAFSEEDKIQKDEDMFHRGYTLTDCMGNLTTPEPVAPALHPGVRGVLGSSQKKVSK